jgi:hypothetical protein
MNHQLERAAVTQSNGSKVTHVARHQPTNTKRFGECHDRTIDEP